MKQCLNESPSINIIYFDDRIGESASNGKTANIYQQWLVVLCVRNAEAQLQQTNEIRKDADPLIRKVLDTLQGFDPKVEGYRMFKRANSPVRIGNSPGFAFFPLMFEIQAYT